MGVFSRTRPGDIPDKDKEVLDSVMNQLYNAIRVMVEDTESNILDSAGRLTPSNLIRFMEYIYGLVDDRSYSINSRIADYVDTIIECINAGDNYVSYICANINLIRSSGSGNYGTGNVRNMVSKMSRLGTNSSSTRLGGINSSNTSQSTSIRQPLTSTMRHNDVRQDTRHTTKTTITPERVWAGWWHTIPAVVGPNVTKVTRLTLDGKNENVYTHKGERMHLQVNICDEQIGVVDLSRMTSDVLAVLGDTSGVCICTSERVHTVPYAKYPEPIMLSDSTTPGSDVGYNIVTAIKNVTVPGLKAALDAACLDIFNRWMIATGATEGCPLEESFINGYDAFMEFIPTIEDENTKILVNAAANLAIAEMSMLSYKPNGEHTGLIVKKSKHAIIRNGTVTKAVLDAYHQAVEGNLQKGMPIDVALVSPILITSSSMPELYEIISKYDIGALTLIGAGKSHTFEVMITSLGCFLTKTQCAG